jgi:hypothetical protein
MAKNIDIKIINKLVYLTKLCLIKPVSENKLIFNKLVYFINFKENYVEVYPSNLLIPYTVYVAETNFKFLMSYQTIYKIYKNEY